MEYENIFDPVAVGVVVGDGDAVTEPDSEKKVERVGEGVGVLVGLNDGVAVKVYGAGAAPTALEEPFIM